MSDLEFGELVEVTAESPIGELGSGPAPHILFRREADSVLGRVTGSCLGSKRGLGKMARRRLVDIGWSKHKPDGAVEFAADVALSHTDHLAGMAVAALRNVFGVTHPAFLTGDVSIGDDPDLPHAEPGPVTDRPAMVWVDRESLEEGIDQALTPVFGSVPKRDQDGDVAVASGTAVVFVRSLPNTAAIRVWAEVTVGVSDMGRARFEIEVLNRDHPFTKFRLVGDRIVAEMHLLAAPFVPEHLRATLGLMCDLVDDVDDDLAVRVSGRRFLEPSEPGAGDTAVHDNADGTEAEVHPAMMALLQLDADRPGSISPAMAAHICDNDRQQLLKLITSEEEQEIEGSRPATRHARLTTSTS